MKMELRRVANEYKSEMVFAVVLSACVGLSYWLGTYIPADFFERSLNPILNGCIATICLTAALLIARHTEGLRVRKVWVFALVCFGVFAGLLLYGISSFVDNPRDSLMRLRTDEMVIANFLSWTLLLYPTEVLRPGWMNVKRALLQSLPVWVAFALDMLFDWDMRILLAAYPLFLLSFLVIQIKEYRKWCEENYSTMDNIDTQWIVRYITMYLLYSFTYLMLCFSTTVATIFTQQWFLLFMIIYANEQILFRPDPWSAVHRYKHIELQPKQTEEELSEQEQATAEPDTSQEANEEYRRLLEEWIEKDKPYCNPEFRLMDLRQVLPMNRTYLSQFINAAYGCNFYQYVTHLRLEEAKRLMRENPEMKLQDVAEQSGFSSPVVFSRVFAREVGVAPRDWNGEN